MSAGTGLSLCQPSGDADCRDLFPGPLFTGAVEYRFWRMGISMEFDYALHVPTGTGADHVSVRAVHGMPVLKVYEAFDAFTGFLGLGLGYSDHWAAETSKSSVLSEARWFSYWSGLKASIGGLVPSTTVLGADMGVDDLAFDLRLESVFNLGGQRCVTWENAGSCSAVSDGEGAEQDIAGSLALGAAARYTF